jgi:hypothetical protein
MSNVQFTSGEPGGTRMDLILAIQEVVYALETGLANEHADRQLLAEHAHTDLQQVLDQTISFGR